MTAGTTPRRTLSTVKTKSHTRCGWKGGDGGDMVGRKKFCPTKKQKDPFDSDQPSHGRPLHATPPRAGSISAIAMFRQMTVPASRDGRRADQAADNPAKSGRFCAQRANVCRWGTAVTVGPV